VPFGAAVLAEVLQVPGAFESVVFSALGVREGYLHGLLSEAREQAVDPLIQGAEELSVLRSRSPAHAHDLVEFTSSVLRVGQYSPKR
jgi:exopolyphosphatase/guanosine-5'-triphosphate,3'-diphosphate pyrophosphatase